MTRINLDKYYTPIETAKKLIDKTFEMIGNENISDVIEPSAGNGSFSLQLNNCLAYDIVPEHSSIIKHDFLSLNIPYKKGRLFIGNPPFGRSNYIAVKFFKKCVSLGDYIAFILPISQHNNTMYMYEFDMIHTENLGKILYSNRKVHCCFNIYKRPKHGLNTKPNYDLKTVVLKTVSNCKTRNDKIPNEYDFSICVWGVGGIGKICEYENQYAKQTYFTVLDKSKVDYIKKIIKKAKWCELYPMTANPNLTNWMINKYLRTYGIE